MCSLRILLMQRSGRHDAYGAPRFTGCLPLRGFSAARVAALVATFVLHALALLCLLPPQASAPLLAPRRMIAVRIDLGDVATSPPSVALASEAKPPVMATPRSSPPSPARAARSRAVPPQTTASNPALAQTPTSETAAAQAEFEPSVPAAPATPPQQAMPEAPAVAAADVKQASQWQALVLAHLHRYRRYPFAAQRARIEGTADLRFRVDRRGHVLVVRIERSSGSAALDEEAVAVVGRAEPLPPPPAEIAGETIEVVVPMQFRLRR